MRTLNGLGVYLRFCTKIPVSFALQPCIQRAVDGKRQQLETSFNKLGEAR